MQNILVQSPSPIASPLLLDRIRAECAAAGGSLPFSRFMDLALYAPGLGYYSGGAVEIGARGDFITAPELSPFFGECLAAWYGALHRRHGLPHILELGGGTGRLAITLLSALARQGLAPTSYQILEVSGALRQRQQEAVTEELAPELAARVRWLDTLPAGDFCGVLLANEVLDALPVRLFAVRADGLMERRVAWDEGVDEDREAARRLWAEEAPASAAGAEKGREERAPSPPPDPGKIGTGAGGFVWREAPAPADLCAAVAGIEADLGAALPVGYTSEIATFLPGWIAALAESMARGALAFVDYGYPRREYYHPERSGGTLVCHHRHRASFDPLVRVGEQDLSAFVDFTAVAEAAQAAGLTVAGYASQARFLLEVATRHGLAPPMGDTAPAIAARAALQRLLLPGEMGERFQILLLGKGLPADALDLGAADQLHRL